MHRTGSHQIQIPTSNTNRFVKVPPKLQNVSIVESNHISPFKKEPALCSRQIKRTRKWQPRMREKLERGRCGFELSVTVLMNSLVQDIVVYPALLCSHACKQNNFTTSHFVLLFIIVTQETFHDSCIFGATTDLGR